MSVNLKPHEYVKSRSGASVPNYRNANHYLRITVKDHAVLFIQKGKIMTEDGEVILFDELEDWAVAEIKKCTPEALRAVGFPNEDLLAELEANKRSKVLKRKELKTARKEAAVAPAKTPPKPPAKVLPKRATSRKPAAIDNLDDELPPLDGGGNTDQDASEGDIG